jgi:hypothetical protein
MPWSQQKECEEAVRRYGLMWLTVGILAIATSGCGSSASPQPAEAEAPAVSTSTTPEPVGEPGQGSDTPTPTTTKSGCPELEDGKCTSKVQHEEAEYRRRSGEGEKKLQEDQRRARGELTPEEESNHGKDQQESAKEVEAIKEGARIKEREEGKVP